MIRRSRLTGPQSLTGQRLVGQGPRRSLAPDHLWPPWYNMLRPYGGIMIARESMVGISGGSLDIAKDIFTGNIIATAAGAARPTLTATGATFDGSSDALSLTYTNASNEYTVFAVVEPDTTTGTQTLLGANTNESVSHCVSANVSAHDGTAARTGMASTARLQLLAVRVGSSKVDFYRDGTQLATATYDDSWSWGASPIIGAAYGAAAGFFDGEIRCFAIVPSALAGADLALWHAVLLGQYGIAYSPLSHAIDGWWSMYADYLTLSGTDVQQLTDRSGLGHHLVKPATANRPAWNAAAGTVDFDAANTEALQCATWGRVRPCTLVGDLLTGGTVNNTMWDGTGGNNGRLYLTGGPKLTAYSGANLIHATANPLAWNRVRVLYRDATSEFAVNGGAATGGNTGSAEPGGLTLGAYGALTQWSTTRFRRHLVSLPYAPTAAELAALDAYLAGAA